MNITFLGGIEMFDTVGRVAVLIKERNMSVSELARRSGINPSTIRSAAMRGTQLSVTTIEHVCDALDMPLWKFFFVPDDLPEITGGVPQ